MFAAACALTALFAAPASADPFGQPNAPAVSDGADHWYCRTSSAAAEVTQINGAMATLDSQTDMYDVNSGTSCGSSTDVVWIRDDDSRMDMDNNGTLETVVRGQVSCVSYAFWAVCDQYWLSYNMVKIFNDTAAHVPGTPAGPFTDNFNVGVAKTMAHELGHTTGLQHNTLATTATCSSVYAAGSDDAMREGWVPTNNAFIFYNSHHVGCHINPQY